MQFLAVLAAALSVPLVQSKTLLLALGWTAVNFGTDVHDAQSVNPSHVSDPPTFPHHHEVHICGLSEKTGDSCWIAIKKIAHPLLSLLG